MDTVAFSVMGDLQCRDDVVRMMRGLYAEDQAAHAPDISLFPTTVEHLVANPSAGQIVLFHEREELVGYAILIPYWSNEFGGNLLFVDELFVAPAYRNRGIAHRFFARIGQERPFDAVALALEVSPGNGRANGLYESLGFAQREYANLIRPLDAAPQKP